MKMTIAAICLIGMVIANFSCKTNNKQEPVIKADSITTICFDSLITPMLPADMVLQVSDKGYIKNGKYYSEKDKKVKHPDGLYSVIETIFDGISQGKDTIRITLK